ncbi:MAG: CPBP family intramembrane metalloprotease [Lachnospiraceae bacterium]|nr:CPBP family intramembrane metalloprotease [Lachnospiraceae bacterium]
MKKSISRLVICFLGSIAGCFGVNTFNRYILMSLPLVGRMLCMPVVYWLIAITTIVLMILDKEKLSDIGFSKERIPAQILEGVACGIAMSVILTLIPHFAGFGGWVDNGHRYKYAWQFIFEFVYCIVAVGAVEEFVFRGYLYSKIKSIYDKDWCAIVVSSVMFGLFHVFSANLIQILITSIIGAIFCFMKLKIKHCSVLLLIISHGVYDALITVWGSLLLG